MELRIQRSDKFQVPLAPSRLAFQSGRQNRRIFKFKSRHVSQSLQVPPRESVPAIVRIKVNNTDVTSHLGTVTGTVTVTVAASAQ